MNLDSTALYLGLMSGTSVDGVDLALTNFNQNSTCQLIAAKTYPFPLELKQQIHQLASASYLSQEPLQSAHPIDPIVLMAELDTKLGLFFAETINQFINEFKLNRNQIIAIGSHGQTIRHNPKGHLPYSLQISDANIIADKTQITTVADFRRMDVAAGGQGAPLVPTFHQYLLHSENENRIILNLGGIANITLLAKDKNLPVIGFDTGPANTLLDAHFKLTFSKNNELSFDNDAQFAQTGKVIPELLNLLLDEEYFSLAPPKSTGRELFNLAWLQHKIELLEKSKKVELAEQDIQATLIALTSKSIANAINQLGLNDFQVYACGGGMHNQFLLSQLGQLLNQKILTTNDLGIDGDFLEAMTFAWLAKRRLENKTGNLTSVTGAKQEKVLGAVYV
jgi:anhydro-N-acetylmuramic acid kinase